MILGWLGLRWARPDVFEPTELMKDLADYTGIDWEDFPSSKLLGDDTKAHILRFPNGQVLYRESIHLGYHVDLEDVWNDWVHHSVGSGERDAD